MTSPNDFIMYTVYERPVDFPTKFVIRRFLILPGEAVPEKDIFAIGDTLDDVRQALPAGLTVMPRLAADDPAIVEVWF